MLFVTNRSLQQSHRSRRNRTIRFNLDDNSALPSIFFCERNAPGDYVEIMSSNFFDRIRDAEQQQVLIFFHGFNELPEDSVFQKAALLQEELGQLCTVVPFIWPCRDRRNTVVSRYYDDQLAADMSGYAFGRALAMFHTWSESQDHTCRKRLNVLAHSMGTRVLRETLRVWSCELLRHDPPLLFRNCFLAASDVVNDTLSVGHGKLMCTASRNVLVYHAYDDFALRASKVANAGQVSKRLGHTGPYDMTAVPANVYSKSCDAFNLEYDKEFGHTYFLTTPSGARGKLLEDIIHCIQTARPGGNDMLRREFWL